MGMRKNEKIMTTEQMEEEIKRKAKRDMAEQLNREEGGYSGYLESKRANEKPSKFQEDMAKKHIARKKAASSKPTGMNAQKAAAVAGLAKSVGGGTSSGESVGGSALGGAATGAGTGAAVGSVVPGIGTAIGAGVGAVIGGVGGALGARSKRKTRQRQAVARGYERQADIEQTKAAQVQNAFQNMMANFRAALIR